MIIDQNENRDLTSRAFGSTSPNPGSVSRRAGQGIFDVLPRIGVVGSHFVTVSSRFRFAFGGVVGHFATVSFSSCRQGPMLPCGKAGSGQAPGLSHCVARLEHAASLCISVPQQSVIVDAGGLCRGRLPAGKSSIFGSEFGPLQRRRGRFVVHFGGMFSPGAGF
jgi:hypothetical protein